MSRYALHSELNMRGGRGVAVNGPAPAKPPNRRNVKLHRARPLAHAVRVSVVIPCYNYGRYLPQCVASVFASPGIDHEIMIVDDCSTDDSLHVAQGLAAHDSRIRVIAHKSNYGHIATYNDGLAAVTGDYVVLLSADDLLTPGALTRAAALMDHHPSVVLVYGHPIPFSEEPPPTGNRCATWTIWTGRSWLWQVCRQGRNLLLSPEAMVRRSALERIGGYDPGHPHAGDMKFWMQAALLGDVGRVNGASQAWYRVHDDNMHSTQFAGLIKDWEEVWRVFEDVLTGPGAPPDAGLFRSAAARALSIEAVRLPLAKADPRETGSETWRRELGQIARVIHPGIVGTHPWRQYIAAVNGQLPNWQRRYYARVHALRWAVRWRRWRLFGV